MPSSADVPEESREDHPLVNFWHKSEWAAFQEKERSKPSDPARGDPQKDSTARYIEDENGEAVSAATLKEIQKTARRVWAMFRECGEAPAQWSKASSNVVNAYRSEMCRQHPELHLCANNWKSEALAMQTYPSWYQNHCKSSVKAEEQVPTVVTWPSYKKKRQNSEVDENKGGFQERAAKKKTISHGKSCRTSNTDDGGGDLDIGAEGNIMEGGNGTIGAMDSFIRKGEQSGPSDRVERNTAGSSEPVDSPFWVCYVIFVMTHTTLTIGAHDSINLVCLARHAIP